MEPNLDRLKLWSDELKTTTKMQGSGRLRNGDKYCCLGIAIEVAMAQGVEVVVKENVMTEMGLSETGTYGYDGEINHLPPIVAEWYGINQTPVLYDPDNHGAAISAISLNDVEHRSFPRIAAAIDATYNLNEAEADG